MAHARDEHFSQFGSTLERALARYGRMSEEQVLANQQRQFETLVGLEDEFRRVLVAHRSGAGVYRDFVRYICQEVRNILAARPYFRERQRVFTRDISVVLKRQEPLLLFKFHFNYQFVNFVVNGPRDCPAVRPRRWGRSRLVKIARQIEDLRKEIVEMNLPLAINRASIFWRRTSQVRLTYMDLVQICAEGLIAAVDKFCLPFTPVWRGVAVGRMVGNLIEVSSDTLLHFYPNDRRKIYRANKVIGRFQGSFAELDFDKLAEHVNSKAVDKEGNLDPSHLTTPEELSGLLSAISHVSSDAPVSQEEPEAAEHSSRFAADDSWRPDVRCEEAETQEKFRRALAQLTPFERKLLRLRGVQA